ncbi:MAG: Endoribonuclease YbeY [Chlamydiae bacterium]|nr:Endoribonuclease YbeY [Chlamydiota bacterium]
MKVLVFNEQSDLPINTETVQPVVKEALALENRRTDEIAVYFVSSQEISRLHKEFFDDPTPTDCISFPMDTGTETGYQMLGEIFVCPKTALDYVYKSGQEINEEIYREVTLYLVHALLHLLGYRDQEPADIKQMREAEKRHLEHFIRKKVLVSC